MSAVEEPTTSLIPLIKFVDALPPIRTGRPDVYDPYTEALKTRPGVWALVHRRPKDTKNAFGGRAGALRKRGCQVRQRTVGDELHLYARWPTEEQRAAEDTTRPAWAAAVGTPTPPEEDA